MLRKATYSGKATELISKVAITQNVFSGINWENFFDNPDNKKDLI